MNEARTYSNSFFSWLYPSRCALCDVLGDASICDLCWQDFEHVDHIQPQFASDLDLAANIVRYNGRVSQAVRRFKYSRATALKHVLASEIAAAVERMGINHYDLIVPVPIHWSRRCARGFNQAELLASCLQTSPQVLQRVKRTKPQAGLTREARLRNLSGAFRATAAVRGKSVLLVDDVLTSGQTARECAKALKARGATKVAALALAGEAF